ncbi:MAG TPA: R2-like ligand-binding oxidase [Gemmatimonadales bacterium]|nr:R2-like ligand-binding oxidase [Gemmatimonadales bacterium]HYT83455.1 R2-like ligand-binding oxidase [Gemmatimonadales bacterium]
MTAAHDRFRTTSSRGLRHDGVPMRLYHEAKRFGAWDPRSLDLRRDGRDWTCLSELERDVLLRLTAGFQAGEESMTLDIPPLLLAVGRREDRLEETFFLSTVLADEAKHTEFFRRFLDEVCRAPADLHRYHTPSFRKLFYEELPRAMARLLDDASRGAEAEALVAYTLVGEGVLAQAGYHVFASALQRSRLLPGLLEGLSLVQRDETRHLAYGVFVLSRLVAEDPAVAGVISRRLDELLPVAVGVVNEFFVPYEAMPFGLSLDDTVSYAVEQFTCQSAHLERARALGAAAAYEDLVSAPVGLAAGALAPGQDGGARREPPLPPSVIELLRWVRRQLAPALVEVRRDAAARVFVFAIERDPVVSALLITQEVFDHHPVAEIVAAVAGARALEQLRDTARLRLTCLRAGARIIVQAPA